MAYIEADQACIQKFSQNLRYIMNTMVSYALKKSDVVDAIFVIKCTVKNQYLERIDIKLGIHS